MTANAEAIARLCDKYRLDSMYAFGSRAREALQWLNGTEEHLAPGASDVDIGVKPKRDVKLTVREKVMLAQALEELLGVARVDLVSIPEADPFVAANIIRGGRLFVRDSYYAAEYELYILRRAGDLAPLERERMELILRKKS